MCHKKNPPIHVTLGTETVFLEVEELEHPSKQSRRKRLHLMSSKTKELACHLKVGSKDE